MPPRDTFGMNTGDLNAQMGNQGDAQFNAFTLNVEANISTLEAAVVGVGEGFMNIFSPNVFAEIDRYATEVQSSFGLSKERMDEFKTTIADVGPELRKLGITEGELAGKLTSIMTGLGTAASLGKEAIVEVAAASKLTGVDVKVLAKSFRDVGISIYDVGDQMKTVAEVARAAGVSVSEVSTQVTQNLGKMNIFNFENGVKGLAKMSAQATRLGIDMDKVFTIANNLMSPEKAIDMSAALQRLGVTSSGLLDPLRAMDMAQNDPEALQKEMVELSKTFTRFNEETGQMEILPGAKRRLREVAEAFGYTGAKGAEEFAAMGIKASDFDMKLKQIRMPNLGEGDEETKELIASMAQMKDGVATIQIRDSKTGITSTKEVDQLTPEDIASLKKANEDSSKSIEDIAFNQLDATVRIENLLATGAVASKFAVATTPALSKFYGLVAESKLDVAKGMDKVFGSTEDMRKYTNSIAQPTENLIKARVSGDEKGESNAKTELYNNFIGTIKSFGSKINTQVDNVGTSIIQRVKETYSQPIKVETKSDSNLNLNLNLKSDISGVNFSSSEIDKIKIAMLNDPDFANKLKKVLENNLVSASTGGKNQ